MKLRQCFFTSTLFMPGVGDLNNNVVCGSKSKFPGMTMELQDNGWIRIETMGKSCMVSPSSIKLAIPEDSK